MSAEVSSADELIAANDFPAAGGEADLAEDADLPDWISNLQGDAAASGDDLPDLVPAGDGLIPGPRLVTNHLQRLLQRVHPPDHDHHRPDPGPDRADLPGLDVLRIP